MLIPREYQLVPLITLNVAPILGVLYLGWAVFDLIFLYWLENLFVGLFMIARMVIRKHDHVGSVIGSLLMAAFFTVHYGMFCAAHGTFVFALFGEPDQFSGLSDLPPFTAFVVFMTQNYLAWFALALFVIHLSDWVMDLLDPDTEAADLNALTRAPYQRIVVLHITLLAGGFLLTAMQTPLAGLLLLILLKTGYDLYGFRKRNLKEDKVS